MSGTPSPESPNWATDPQIARAVADLAAAAARLGKLLSASGVEGVEGLDGLDGNDCAGRTASDDEPAVACTEPEDAPVRETEVAETLSPSRSATLDSSTLSDRLVTTPLVAVLLETGALREPAEAALHLAGATPIWASSLEGLVQTLRTQDCALILVEDVGTRLTSWLEEAAHATPLGAPCVVLGGPQGFGLAAALDSGAADYCAAHATPADIAFRLEAQIRKFCRDMPRRATQRGYCLDARSNTISYDAQSVTLTAREFAIAQTLFAREGRVVDIDTLAGQGWGHSGDICKRRIEQHISNLRRKLPAGAQQRARIHAVYGVGYRLAFEERHRAL